MALQCFMADPIRILTVELEDEFGIILTFSDGTHAGYVVEELLELRPQREHTIPLDLPPLPM